MTPVDGVPHRVHCDRITFGEVPVTSVGLVLGGGGVTGMAYHVGTLLALELDLGWDPRTADVLVGTSAGSVVGALIRAGLDMDDLAAWASDVPARSDRHHLRDAVDRVDDVGFTLARRGLHSKPGTSLPSLLRTILDVGVLDGFPALVEVGQLFDGWPADPLLIPAVRAVGGARVVFGRDSTPSVSLALAASCAIPLLFRPVWVAGDLYVDGGVHSPTNADILIGQSVDLAVILSPMTGSARDSRRGCDGPIRALARARLAREVRALEAAGIDTLVFEPDPTTVRAAGWNLLNRARVGAVVRASFLSALDARASNAERAGLIDRLRTTRLARVPA